MLEIDGKWSRYKHTYHNIKLETIELNHAEIAKVGTLTNLPFIDQVSPFKVYINPGHCSRIIIYNYHIQHTRSHSIRTYSLHKSLSLLFYLQVLHMSCAMYEYFKGKMYNATTLNFIFVHLSFRQSIYKWK